MSYQWNSHAVTDSRLTQQIMGQFSDWRVLTANMWHTSQNSGRVCIAGVGISLELAMLLKEAYIHGFQHTRCKPKFSKHCMGC